MINLLSIQNKCQKLKSIPWYKWCLVIILLSSNPPSYLEENITKNIKILKVKNLTLNKKMIMKIMMIKCILWKKIIKVISMTNMVNKKILSWLLDKILELSPEWKTMPNNSTMHHNTTKKISKTNIINSPNHNLPHPL